MAFKTNNLVGADISSPQQLNNPTPALSGDLELQELEFLIQVLGNADLKGNQVEMFYSLVIKLQSQYIQKSKKQLWIYFQLI